ncbi:MAG: hypothetical protein WD226_10740 [Planctomycetota bacterium]
MSAWLVLVALCLAGRAGDARAWPVEVELRGPLEGVEFDLGPAGSARIVGRLVPGERRTVELPLPLALPFGTGEVPVPALEPVVDGAGSARVLGWAPARELDDLPAGLSRRPRPPAPSSAPPPRAPALLAGLALVLVAWRGPRRVGPAIALVGAPLLAWWVAGTEPAVAPRTVIEVDLAAGKALRVSAWGRHAHWRGRARVEAEPPGAPLEIVLDLQGREPEQRARVVGRGHLVVLRAQALTSRGDLAERLGVAFEQRWTRAADGAWRGPGTPPGWLVAGLPQGVPLTVGRTETGDWVRASGR